MNVNGSIGYGVSVVKNVISTKFLKRDSKTPTIEELNSIGLERFISALSNIRLPIRPLRKWYKRDDDLPLLANLPLSILCFPLSREVQDRWQRIRLPLLQRRPNLSHVIIIHTPA